MTTNNDTKPSDHPKRAVDMTPAERDAAIRAAKAASSPAAAQAEPSDPPRRAVDMSVEERAKFLSDHSKQFPDQTNGMSLPRKSQWK